LAWYYGWRVAAGACGALLMVVAAPVVITCHSPQVRGRASGVVFSGIGLGAALSGALIPLLIAGLPADLAPGTTPSTMFTLHGPFAAWMGMGMVCLLLTLLAWAQWPDEPARKQALPAGPAGVQALPAGPTGVQALPAEAPLPPSPEIRRTVRLILLAHGLNALGYLAHTMFWVDYLVRELGLSLARGGFYWAMFGLGAAIGPLITGTAADALGIRRCLVAGFALKAAAAVLPVLDRSPPVLLVSSLLMGIFTPGLAALVSAYALDRVGPLFHRKTWGWATTSFALAQALGGAAMAYAAARLSSYQPLFFASAAALIGSVACILLIPERDVKQRDPIGEQPVPAPEPMS
jgi:MFS family permease